MTGNQYARKQIEYNSSYNVVLSNDIIRGKQTCNILEARFIRLVIAQIEQSDTELWEYTTSVKEFAEFFGINKSNLYKDMQDKAESIRRCGVMISTGNPKKPWTSIGWFDKAEYENGMLTFTLSQSMKPYVIGLKEFFTQCKLKYFVCLTTVYGIRLYEIIQAERGETKKNTIVLSYQYLREVLLSVRKKSDKTDNRYPKFANFKNKIIDGAVKDINDNTDLFIKSVTGETYGNKSTVDVVFEIEGRVSKTINKEPIPFPESNKSDTEQDELAFLGDISEKDKKKIMKAANNDIAIIREKYELSLTQNIRDLTPWLISAIKDNYTIKPKVSTNKFNNFPQRDYSKQDFNDIERLLMQIDYTKEV